MRKTIILTYFLITVFTINSIVQDFWELVNIPDSINPSKLDFNSFGDVFMGSSNGVYKSNDEGETWIHCGGLYKSIDSGYTWTQVLSTVNAEVFNDIIEKDSLLFTKHILNIHL